MRRIRRSDLTALFVAVACIPVAGVSDERLSDAQLDMVTAGAAVERPTGIVTVEADARGSRTNTFVISSASATAYGSPGLPSGAGTVVVNTYGVSYARSSDGLDSSVSATANGVNEQPGLTSGPGELRWVANSRYSQIAIYSAKSVSSSVLNRHALFSRAIPYR